MKIHLMNHMPFGSSIQRYGYDIKRSIPIQAIFTTFSFRPSSWNSLQLHGEERLYKGAQFPLNNFEVYLNTIFMPYIFQKEITLIKSDVEQGLGIVHYLDHLFPLIKGINKDHQIVTMHENIYSDLNFDSWIYKKRASRLSHTYMKFNNVLAVSNYVKGNLEKNGWEGKITTIPLAVSPEFKPLKDKHEIRKKYKLPIDKILILSISTMVRRKNLITVKNVMEKLGGEFNLVRIGSPIGNSFSFHELGIEQVNEIYNACDLLLFPSLEEGFAYPPREAMTVGLPVVASNIPSISEGVGDAALLVEPTVEGCVKGINDALNMREELQEKGFRKASDFSIEMFGKKMTTYYASEMGNKNA